MSRVTSYVKDDVMPVAAPAPVAAPPAPRRQRRRWRLVALLLASVVLVLLAIETYRVAFGDNFHTVIPGRVYRCAQPSAAAIDQMVADHGIRTVINLRGNGDPFPWYLEEARATHDHNVCQEDICFSAGRLPPISELRRFVEVLEKTEYPILLHCRRGADRTGMAAAIVLLLSGETTPEAACRQLGLRFGHVAIGRPAQLDLFLDFYGDWLRSQGKTHSAAVFRDWVLHHYCPGACLCELSLLEPLPGEIGIDKPLTIAVRARNTSIRPWLLNPLVTAGTHLGCHVFDEHDTLVETVKTGLRDEQVLPGQSVDFTVCVEGLSRPGRYRLMLDMIDEQQCWFYQTGSQPLELEVTARE
jgi:protein tyrosine/serine phosphatase